VPARRLVATLAGFGALAGLLLSAAYKATLPRITAHKEEMLGRAVREVLKEPERFERIEVPGGDRVYVGFGPDGKPVGFAIDASAAGFADNVRVLFGYDAAARKLLGMKVLESKETPGLGDRIEKDPAFRAQFDGAAAPLLGVRAGGRTGAPGEVDLITGATISSKTVLRVINGALDRLRPALEAWRPEEKR
jgi:electron transport complex protein RnfG